jgi:hypothetical protein
VSCVSSELRELRNVGEMMALCVRQDRARVAPLKCVILSCDSELTYSMFLLILLIMSQFEFDESVCGIRSGPGDGSGKPITDCRDL